MENDSASLWFSLADEVFADYELSLTYSGTEILSADSGLLKTFSNLPVINYSKGLPFQIKDGWIDSSGIFAVLEFDKPLAMAIEQTSYFTLKVNGNSAPIKDMFIANTITILPSNTIHFGDVVTVSYIPGNITATDRGVLESFSDFELSNPIEEPEWITIPGKIEAEDYMAQSGIQTEGTGDTGGGLNVGWIDDGDWMEYAINNNTTDTLFTATFRVASPYGGGLITVFLDDVNIGQVGCPNTGGWQTYWSRKTDLEINPGSHYLRLYATRGGFNINYIDMAKKEITGMSEINSDKIMVYPNPVTQELNIESGEIEFTKVEITNINGRVMLTRSVAGMFKIQLPVSLPDGIYIVKISNENQLYHEKIMVKNN
ncbi:hypothetical protein ES705_23091 [subsurface metagenome]